MRGTVALLLGAAVACGGRGDDGKAADSAVAATAPQEVSIVARDFAYEAPDTIRSGMTTLRLKDLGPEPHHVQIVRLLEGRSHADLMGALQTMKPTDPIPAWMRMIAGPNVPAPGTESNLTTSLEPGPYALLCFVESAGHVPHFAKGMVKPFTVVPAAGPSAAAPVADINVALTDYTWTITPAITAGRHTLKIENSATQPHELVLLRLNEGKSEEDALKWAETFAGPPPFAFAGGISNMAPAEVAYTTIDVTGGNYVLVCFFPDAKDGRPHVMHGMVMPLTVS